MRYNDIVARVEVERDHSRRRAERVTALADADRVDTYEESDYHTGRADGLDKALLIIQQVVRGE
jgi:hypothetical protein